jgi:hypothetical protein
MVNFDTEQYILISLNALGGIFDLAVIIYKLKHKKMKNNALNLLIIIASIDLLNSSSSILNYF